MQPANGTEVLYPTEWGSGDNEQAIRSDCDDGWLRAMWGRAGGRARGFPAQTQISFSAADAERTTRAQISSANPRIYTHQWSDSELTPRRLTDHPQPLY